MIATLDIPQSAVEAFLSRPVAPSAVTGCREWPTRRDVEGYGRLEVDGRIYRVHRIAYVASGRRLVAGMVIDHLCRNTSCVEATHLEAVTCRENTERGTAPSAAGIRARREGRCANGHLIAEVGLYWRRDRGTSTCAECARAASRRYAARRSAVRSGALS